MNTMNAQAIAPAPSQAAVYNKSQYLLGLIYGEGFSLAKTAYTFKEFSDNLQSLNLSTPRGSGRIPGTDEMNYYMLDNKIVGIWNEDMGVGVTAYSNRVPAFTVH